MNGHTCASQSNGIRKSSRKPAVPERLGFERRTHQLPPVDLPDIPAAHREDPSKWYPVAEEVEDYLVQYNALKKFLPRHRTAHVESTHKRIQKRRDKIHSLYSKYIDELAVFYHEVRRGKIALSNNMSQEQHWYAHEDSNLLDLNLETLEDLLEDHEIHDPKHYQLYLVRILPGHLDQFDEKATYNATELLEQKLKNLVDALARPNAFDSLCLSLHVCASWTATIAKDRRRRSFIGICDMLEEHAAKILDRRRDNDSEESREYWDTAAAWRDWMAAYKLFKCRDEYWCDPSSRPRCYHIDVRPFLERLWDVAYSEISEQVQIAVQHELPAELAELVLEYALQSEDLTPENRFGYYDHKKKSYVNSSDELRCDFIKVNRSRRESARQAELEESLTRFKRIDRLRDV